VSAVVATAVYQVYYPDAPLQPDLLGLWQPEKLEGSFAVGSEMPGVVWRANLPGDEFESARILSTQSLSLRQTALALQAAGPLLSRDLQRASVNGRPKEGETPAFDITSTSSGRYDLLTQGLYYDPGSLSFGVRDELSEAVQTVSGFAASVHRLVDRFALVESSLGGLPSARTRLDWLGDVHTWWLAGSPPPTIRDHRRVLAQAIATRQAWLRLATLLTAGAAKIGLSMAAGPFNPVAIMTAWKYIQKVIEQYRVISQVGARLT
jgi:hypothetical protein